MVSERKRRTIKKRCKSGQPSAADTGPQSQRGREITQMRRNKDRQKTTRDSIWLSFTEDPEGRVVSRLVPFSSREYPAQRGGPSAGSREKQFLVVTSSCVLVNYRSSYSGRRCGSPQEAFLRIFTHPHKSTNIPRHTCYTPAWSWTQVLRSRSSAQYSREGIIKSALACLLWEG